MAKARAPQDVDPAEQAPAEQANRLLDEMLEEGLRSGPPIPFTDSWWQERKAALLATLPDEVRE